MRIQPVAVLLAFAFCFFAGADLLPAANFYWRSIPVNNLFTDIQNWETSPGGGLIPATAPAANDDVFFPATSTITAINLGGACRDFNVLNPGSIYIFTGVLTGGLYGSINCPNGNVTFNLNSGTLNINGIGNHVINVGSSSPAMTQGTLSFNNTTNAGTYTLLSPLLTTNVSLAFESQNFTSNGFPIRGMTLLITGTSPKTIDFSNSLVTINPSTNGGGINFEAPSSSTNYQFSGTDMVLNHIAVSFNSGVSIATGTSVTMDELSLNANATSNNLIFMEGRGNTTTPGTLSTRVLRLNTPNLSLGRTGFINSSTNGLAALALNIDTLVFAKPSTITNDKEATLNLGAVVEAPLCRGQSAILCHGASPMLLNTSVPLSTSSIAYYGVVFGGSGVAASTTFDLGNNAGAVTWGGGLPSSTFWWVGGTGGNWDDPTKWSTVGSGGLAQSASGCLPTLADDVVFDAPSFSGPQTVTIRTSNGFCRNLSWTGSNQGSLAGGRLIASVNYAGNLYVNGNADFLGARSVGVNQFFVGDGVHTIRSCTHLPGTSPAVRIMGTGSYTLSNPMLMDSTASTLPYFQHTGGGIITAGQTMDFGNWCSRSFPEINANLRVLDITNSVINIRGVTIVAGRRNIDVSYLTTLNATGSHFRLHDNTTACYFSVLRGSASPIYLSVANLNDISFIPTSGTPNLAFLGIAGLANYTVNFNNVNFASNANILGTSAVIYNNVNHYNLTSGRTYTFTAGTNQPYNVLVGINHIVNGCQDLVRIQSSTPGSQARIFKAGPPFDVNGAYIQDIHASGQTINVINGVNAGNNTNITVSPGLARAMYWVNNAGNWSDGLGHWSINVPNGNPAVNNPLGCIPRPIDNVFFDLSSFTLGNQAVQLDIDGNCRNMLWTPDAGADIPRFEGIANRILNVYGSLEMAVGMTSPYLGRITMQGSSTLSNSQSIDMNGVIGNGSIWLSGGGRYDLLDSIRIVTVQQGLRLINGDFRTNGHPIYASAVNLDVRNGNAADISNSTIRVFEGGTGVNLNVNTSYGSQHNASGTWNASGSTIWSDLRAVSINNVVPIRYGDIVMNTTSTDADIVGSATQPVTFDNVSWLKVNTQATGGSYMGGIFTMDTLRYAKSSFNTLGAGGARTYTVLDTLIVTGTPCLPAYIRSAVNSVVAPLSIAACNLDLRFVNFRDINAATCTAAQNQVVGTDEGGNNNLTFTGINAFTPLGNDTTIVCNAVPLSIDGSGFGNEAGMSYLWSTGATTPQITTTAAGTYTVTVSFGPGCNLTDQLVVTCTAPLPLPAVALHGQVLGPHNQLDWQLPPGNAVQRLDLERSAGGQAFTALQQIDATASGQAFTYTDAEAPQGTALYRLRLTGHNGASQLSNTVALTRLTGVVGISCAPNPTTGTLHLDLQGFGPGATARLHNLAGQLVATMDVQAGGQELDLCALPNALYSLEVLDEQGRSGVVRVQVQR